MTDTLQASLRVDPAHPSLAGHFPDYPIVPGVVVLERVAATWKAWRGASVGGLAVKFMQPLRPGEAAAIELHGDASRVRFVVTRADGVALVRGTLEAAQGVVLP